MKLSRRDFFGTAAAFPLAFGGLQTLLDRLASQGITAASAFQRFGPLVPDPDKILDLPQDFRYQVVSRTGDRMNDGFQVPGAPDGMAAFPTEDGLTVVVRNHELNSDSAPGVGPFGADNAWDGRIASDLIYDSGQGGAPMLGGTTTFVYDTEQNRLVSQHLSLAGTLRNCAGGPTPWGSWVTCEETNQRAGDVCAQDHGYCFEVPATADHQLARPTPLKAMGRFSHEAVAVDPQSGVVYETEDRGDGLIYRFIPNEAGRLAEGGRLQALAIVDRPSLDVRNWEAPTVALRQQLATRWIDLDDPEAPEDDLRLRGFNAGAARFARGEGMWYGNGAIYFACTNGGSLRKGQIWKYTPSAAEGRSGESERPGYLELFAEPNDGAIVENADNLTVAPWGDLIVCEDGSEDQFIVGVTPEGEFYKFGHNVLNTSEFAGATFSPDGRVLFVNIQYPGITLAITGPWTE